MMPVRIISRLDIKGENIVKGIHLEGLRIIGDPATYAEEYYLQGVDEILYMDTVASLYGRNNILSVVREAAKNLFVPLTVGGGISSIEDITSALRHGADKVAINTAAVKDPEFLKKASRVFGSQCIVLSVEAKQRDGYWEALTDNGRELTGLNVIDWVKYAEDLGVGEILLTSVDQEGTGNGYDLDLLKAVRETVDVPIIACGGAGNPQDLAVAALESRVDAAGCASILHYKKSTIPEIKNIMTKSGVCVRQ